MRTSCLRYDRFLLPRARAAAEVRDEAIGTEAVAAVLDAEIGARPRLLRGGEFGKADFGLDEDALLPFAEKIQEPSLALRARDEKDALTLPEIFGMVLRGTAADDDEGIRVIFAHPGDRLTALLFRLPRHRAGVEKIQIGRPELLRRLVAERLEAAHEGSALHLVELAPEGEHARPHRHSPSACIATDKRAMHAVSARRMRFPSETPV